MRKILGLTIAALLIMGLVGGGTWALFSDTETVSDNVFAAGTLDLQVDHADGISAKFTATNAKPGDIIAQGNINLKNNGTIDASKLTIDISYVEDPSEPAEPTDPDLNTELDADEFAENIEVIALACGTNLIWNFPEDPADANNFVDLKEVVDAMTNGTLGEDLAGIVAGNDSKSLNLAFKLHETAGNDVMADGIVVTFTFMLEQ